MAMMASSEERIEQGFDRLRLHLEILDYGFDQYFPAVQLRIGLHDDERHKGVHRLVGELIRPFSTCRSGLLPIPPPRSGGSLRIAVDHHHGPATAATCASAAPIAPVQVRRSRVHRSWFVSREFRSSLLDEGGHTLEVIARPAGGVLGIGCFQ